MAPTRVAAVLAGRGWWRAGRVSVKPVADIEVVELLGPDQTGIGLALDEAFLLVETGGQRSVERVGFGDAGSEDTCGIGKEIVWQMPAARGAKAEEQRLGLPWRQHKGVVSGNFGAGIAWVDRP